MSILIGFCVCELQVHLCPHSNVWPEAVYCCFTRTTLFTKLCGVSTKLLVSITSPSFIALHLLVSEVVNVLPVYCCFTRTTMFTTMFTMIVFVEKCVYQVSSRLAFMSVSYMPIYVP